MRAMQASHADQWLHRQERCRVIVSSLTQPLTVQQLARRAGLRLSQCTCLLRALRRRSLVRCLNEEARRSRVYWLTRAGRDCQRQFRALRGLAPPALTLPEVDWALYGWICFSHRAAILKALDEPLQPSAIKRRARCQDDGLRMSANNVRDVIRLFVQRGIVHQVMVRKKAHPRYELTRTGRMLRELLFAAETPIQTTEDEQHRRQLPTRGP